MRSKASTFHINFWRLSSYSHELASVLANGGVIHFSSRVQSFEQLWRFFFLLLASFLLKLSYHLVAHKDAAVGYALRASAGGWAGYMRMCI